MTGHAACGPSSANMWLACPASITLAKGRTRPSSKYAREGTAAHAVAEMTLKGDPFLPDRIDVEGEQFIVGRDMLRALRPYIDHVEALAKQPGAFSVFESRIKVPATSGFVWGTLDCGVKNILGDIEIVDLKFGKGHVVDPDTPQLKLYALGFASAVMNLHNDLDIKVTTTICQPRAGCAPIRSAVTMLGDLREWLYTEVQPAIELIKSGDETESAGSHCRWCVRQTECKAFAGLHQVKASSVFDDIEEAT